MVRPADKPDGQELIMNIGSVPSFPLVGALLLIGFCVGVAGSFFGVGGAFMVTPGLNILGFPMAYAIGTDLAHMIGKSIIAAVRHRRLGHIDIKAGFFLFLGTIPGVKLGAMTIMKLEPLGATEPVVRIAYIVLLLIIGTLVLRESLSARRGKEFDKTTALLIRRFQVKPLVSLKTSEIESISVWGMVLLGLVTGFLASFLGVGGGFIRMPAMVYLMGMPTCMAVGTDLLEVVFSSGYGTYLYALEGRVDVIAALIMLAGAGVGSHLGTLATRYTEPCQIRLYFGITILGSAAAVAAKQFGLKPLAVVILLTLGLSLACTILFRLAEGIRAERKTAAAAAEPEPAASTVDI